MNTNSRQDQKKNQGQKTRQQQGPPKRKAQQARRSQNPRMLHDNVKFQEHEHPETRLTR